MRNELLEKEPLPDNLNYDYTQRLSNVNKVEASTNPNSRMGTALHRPRSNVTLPSRHKPPRIWVDMVRAEI